VIVMDAREGIKQTILILPQLAAKSNGNEIKADIDLLMGVASQLVTVLVNRNSALAQQKNPQKSLPPKPAPQKTSQKQKPKPSSADTQNGRASSKDQAKALSSIQQGILRARPKPADQKRALLGKVYGAQNDERAFRLAAKAITS
jgi:hypothetical protein